MGEFQQQRQQNITCKQHFKEHGLISPLNEESSSVEISKGVDVIGESSRKYVKMLGMKQKKALLRERMKELTST